MIQNDNIFHRMHPKKNKKQLVTIVSETTTPTPGQNRPPYFLDLHLKIAFVVKSVQNNQKHLNKQKQKSKNPSFQHCYKVWEDTKKRIVFITVFSQPNIERILWLGFGSHWSSVGGGLVRKLLELKLRSPP